MTDDSTAPDGDPAASEPRGDQRSEFARPAGLGSGFDTDLDPYTPPPRTVPLPSEQERAEFGAPADGAPFAPGPGERLAPRHAFPAPVAPLVEAAFRAGPDAKDGFAPADGDRRPPRGREPESPWWRLGAARDPWRDPSSPFWLGRGAEFTLGRPTQLDPDDDEETDGEPTVLAEPTPDGAAAVTRLKLGPRLIVVSVLVVALVAAVGGGIGWFLTKQTDQALHRPDVHIAQVDPSVTRPPGSVAEIAKRVGPAVVSIQVQTGDDFAVGSGVVIDGEGDVLTNNHVVAAAAGGAGSIVVTFSDEATAKAQIVGRDPISDLAVIKVPADRLTVAQLGDSSKLAVGDPVIAIGSPLGLQGTVTAGIVSALNRPVHVSNDDGSSDAYLDAIQTDAAINPGNSGGALVDSAGAVIGINSAGALGSVGPNGTGAAVTGIGYAIPISYARTVALELIHTGKATHASLGATGSTAVAGQSVGAYLKQVDPGGAAAKAGLKPGDVVVAADGTLVQSFDQLQVIVQQHKPGDTIEVTYYPSNSSSTSKVDVTLG